MSTGSSLEMQKAAIETALNHYNTGINFSLGDIEIHQFGIKYVLLRLGSAGLTQEDQADLKALVAAATQNRDVTDVASKIINRQAASPLAAATAALALHGRGDNQAIVLGALFGAYATLDRAGSNDPDRLRDILQAVSAGAVAAATLQFTQEQAKAEAWRLLLQRE
jgi:hypothetical protein